MCEGGVGGNRGRGGRRGSQLQGCGGGARGRRRSGPDDARTAALVDEAGAVAWHGRAEGPRARARRGGATASGHDNGPRGGTSGVERGRPLSRRKGPVVVEAETEARRGVGAETEARCGSGAEAEWRPAAAAATNRSQQRRRWGG